MNFLASECLYTGLDTVFTDVRPDPAPGAVNWYLVRGLNSCGNGTYGSPQRDLEIGPCP